MTDDRKLPRNRFVWDRLQYQWYTGYDPENEYNMNPAWADDMETAEDEVVEDGGFTAPRIVFFNENDPERRWIRSDTVYDLTRTL